MPHKKAVEFEFDWVGDRLVHKPTGYEWWWAYPGTPADEIRVRAGTLGDMLSEGPAYRLDELNEIAHRLLAARPA